MFIKLIAAIEATLKMGSGVDWVSVEEAAAAADIIENKIQSRSVIGS